MKFDADDTAVLVYQAGLANVFKYDPHHGRFARVRQADFGSCEEYCRGLRDAGIQIDVAWCNMAGDILLQREKWQRTDFDNAPFNDSFATDFVPQPDKDRDGATGMCDALGIND